ncbi:sensor histidine kinase [Pseudonocardia xinjiangensis]|uniref:sensor histidine kinase n=1 Tax=Pseudonocardia xinjiangensis TaxID=75289 RepID=UPI003D8C3D88
MVNRQVRADVALALLCGACGLTAAAQDQLPGGVEPAEWASIAVGVAGLGTVFWRRRWPVPFAVAAIAFAAVAPLANYLPLVGVFTVAALRGWPATPAVVALSAGAGAVRLWWVVDVPELLPPLIVASVVLVAAAAGWGLFIGARQQLLMSLRERAERAEAEQAERALRARADERRRIAREMHDALGHRLSLLSVHAGALELRRDLTAQTVERTATVLRETAHAALADLREIVLLLREPPTTDLEGPPLDGPQPRLGDLPDLVAQSRAAGTAVVLDLDPALHSSPPPDRVASSAYRVVQEGLTNARRHAPGASVRVEVSGRQGEGLTVEVTTEPASPARPVTQGSGTGLIGLSERLDLIGGTLEHAAGTDGGHRLAAHIPWPGAGRER